MKDNTNLEKGWDGDDSPYRTALAHAMTFALTALNDNEDDIGDKIVEARIAVDNEVRKILAQQRSKDIEEVKKIIQAHIPSPLLTAEAILKSLPN